MRCCAQPGAGPQRAALRVACGRRRGTCRGSCAGSRASMSSGAFTSARGSTSSAKPGATARTRSSCAVGLRASSRHVREARRTARASSLTVWWPAGARDGIDERRARRRAATRRPRRSGRRAARARSRSRPAASRRARPTPRCAGRRSSRTPAARSSRGRRPSPRRRRRTSRRRSGSPRPTRRAGAISSRCLTWIVETTASRAVKRSPSSVSTPAQRPPSTSSRVTRCRHTTRPAVLLDAAHERVGERARPAARQRPRAPLAAEDDRVRELPRAAAVDRHERLEGLPEQERLDVPAPRTRGGSTSHALIAPPAQPDASARVLGEPLLERRAEARPA